MNRDQLEAQRIISSDDLNINKHLGPRDVCPGDYVYVRLHLKEDNTLPTFTIEKVFGACETHMIVKEGSGYTKYAWSEVFPIKLTEENIEKFNMIMLNDPRDDYRMYGYKLVTIDPTYLEDGNYSAARFYFNDGDYREIHYMHEAQHYAYDLSNNTFDFDIEPVCPNQRYALHFNHLEDECEVLFE